MKYRTAPLGHDRPCPWCGHSHQFLGCDDCECAPHPLWPGDA